MSTPLFENLDETHAFERRLTTRALGKHIVFEQRTQSTNDLALDAARNGAAHGTVFVADAQDRGRGRRGRDWECPPGTGLLFSVLIRPDRIPPEAAGWVPLAAGLSCADALSTLSRKLKTLTVKWPNDIVLPSHTAPGWRKMGGILCESALPALSGQPPECDAGRGYIVVGIGLNLNQTRAMLSLPGKAPATSVRIETGCDADRKAVLQSVLERLEIHLDSLGDPDGRVLVRSVIQEKMRAWMTSTQFSFRHPPLGTGEDNLHRGAFNGLDEFGRIRFKEGAETATYADAEIIAKEERALS